MFSHVFLVFYGFSLLSQDCGSCFFHGFLWVSVLFVHVVRWFSKVFYVFFQGSF